MSIINYLKYGKINAVKRSDLSIVMGTTDRLIRKEIEQKRLNWSPLEPFICSDPQTGGYWLTNDISEVENFRKKYNSYRTAQGKVVANIDIQLAKLKGENIVYVKAHTRRIKGG